MRKRGAECVLISYDGGVWGLCKVYLFLFIHPSLFSSWSYISFFKHFLQG